MSFKHAIISLVLLFIFTGCYATITGTVVDAENGEPIEGAVVLVEWTVTKGFGLTYHKSYKVIEVITDKDGKATVSGVFNPLVNPPHVTIYKKGYVAWNNEYIFPTYGKRTDFKWQNGYVFRLERFKPEYTHDVHVTFIRRTYSFGLGANSEFEKAWHWEALLALEEVKKKSNK